VQISHIVTKFEFSGQISVNIPNIKFNRIPSCGRELCHADGLEDGGCHVKA